MDLLVDTKSQI